MATLALGLVGPALGPGGFASLVGGGAVITSSFWASVIGAAGAGLGAYIDARYVFPPKGAHSTGVDEFNLSLASEGTPMPRPWGAAVRVPGSVIFASDVISAAVTGGSSKSGKITNKNYYATLAVAFGDGSHATDSPIIVWADGTQLYNANGIDLSQTSNLLTVTAWKLKSTTVNAMRIVSAVGGPDLTAYKAGKNATTTNFTNAGNNVTGQVLSTGAASGVGTAMYIANAGAVTEAAGASATITQTLDALDKSKVTSITKYRGSTTQTADTIIESFEGSGNVPGFRDTHYVVLEKVYLGPYGNRIPQFQGLVKKASSQSLQTVIGALLEAAGLASTDYDVTALSGNVAGYAIPGPESAADSVARLIVAYNLIVQEVGGKLVFKVRTSPDSITVREADLAAHAYGEDSPRPLEITDGRSLELPSEVNVSYQDSSTDYQRGVQKFRRIDATQTTVQVVDLFTAPVVLTAAEALAISKRALWSQHANRQTAAVSLPPSMWHLAENDRLTVPADSDTHTLLVTQANRGANGVVAVESMVEQAQVLA